MRLSEAFRMWKNLVKLGLDEMRLGFGMIADAKREKNK
jgi:hypothetical protein